MGQDEQALTAERELEAARYFPRAGATPEGMPENSSKLTSQNSRDGSMGNASPQENELSTTKAAKDEDLHQPKSQNARARTPLHDEKSSSRCKEDAHRNREHRRRQSYVRNWLDKYVSESGTESQHEIAPSSATTSSRGSPSPTISTHRFNSDPKPTDTSETSETSETDTASRDFLMPSSDLRASHLSHINVHQDFWEIVEDDDLCCNMCGSYGTLLQCPACVLQSCQHCKSALSAPGATFGPRAKANWL